MPEVRERAGRLPPTLPRRLVTGRAGSGYLVRYAAGRTVTVTVGKYRVLSRVGRGGMGEVFKAVQSGLDREVALKVLSEDASAQRATERFLREAKLQAKLEHPNLVRVFDAGQAGSRLYFAMELVEGDTLSKWLADHGRPHPSFVAKVARQMASAFAYYHPLGMVHRDIKPSNLMIQTGEEQTLKLMDFGIAIEAGAKRLTRTRAVVGTARYLSPEMARGEEPTGASDVYQLGLILYEMLVGAPPHPGPPAVAIARRAAGERAPDPREAWPACPDRMAELVNGCLAPNPEERPPPAWIEEEAEALELKLRGWEVPAGPLPPWKPPSLPTAPVGMPSGPMAVASGGQPAVPSAPYSRPAGAVGDGHPARRLAWLVPLVLGALVLGRWVAGGGDFRAEQVVVRPGARGVVITWSSPRRYESRIRYGPESTPQDTWSTAVGSDDGYAHRLVLEGLEPGQKYLFHVVFPNGGRSLDHSLVGPQPFRLQHLRVSFAGPEELEWRFHTPVEVRCQVQVETASGKPLSWKESEPSGEHLVRFPIAELVRPPRKVTLSVEAADGRIEPAWPPEVPVSVMRHLAKVFGPEGVNWPELINRIDDVRFRTDDSGRSRGWAIAEWQAELQAIVKRQFEGKGLLENWGSLAPRITEFAAGDAPFSEKRELVNGLAWLSSLDRVYELYSLPPPFQVFSRLAPVMSASRTPPIPEGEAVVVRHEFAYSANMLVPSNYTAKARGQINTMATTVFPQKGEVRTALEGVLELPEQGRFEEAALGVSLRGMYPFSLLVVHLGEGTPLATMVPFYQESELSDAPLKDEFSALLFLRGKSMDEVFPVHNLWMRVPPELLARGRNKVRLELISLSHHSILPSVVRQVVFMGRGKAASGD